MTQTISSKLQKDTKKLEESYFRSNEIDNELGFSTSLISDINKARKKQRLIWFFILLFIILAFFTFPFLRIRIFKFWHTNTIIDPGKPPGPDDTPPADSPDDQKGPLN